MKTVPQALFYNYVEEKNYLISHDLRFKNKHYELYIPMINYMSCDFRTTPCFFCKVLSEHFRGELEYNLLIKLRSLFQ